MQTQSFYFLLLPVRTFHAITINTYVSSQWAPLEVADSSCPIRHGLHNNQVHSSFSNISSSHSIYIYTHQHTHNSHSYFFS